MNSKEDNCLVLCNLIYPILPLSVKFIGLSFINLPKFLLQVGSQVYGRVEVFPDKSVMLDIPYTIMRTATNICKKSLLDKVLLCDIARGEVSDTVDRDYTNILYCTKKILER